MTAGTGVVVAVCRSPVHAMAKQPVEAVTLVAGHGVDGDTHAGRTVQHLSRVRRDPTAPNLRQVHLVAAELHDELRRLGYDVAPGDLGENVPTRGVDLLGLPRGALLRLGGAAEVEVTGLRNPCRQLEDVGAGLLSVLFARRPDGTVALRAGVMAVVRTGGPVRAGDPVAVGLPAAPRQALERV